MPITLFLIDDHTLLRRGLTALLAKYGDLRVVGEAGDVSEATRLLPGLQPDVILLDNHLPGVRGLDAIAGLRELVPHSEILMLTVSDSEQDLASALRSGARGYLLKTIDGSLLAEAIRQAARGESVVSQELTSKLVAALKGPEEAAAEDVAASPLSPREEDVLREIARGASNKEIARSLDIAETTVKIHVQHILRKLGLSSRVQAAVYAAAREP